MHDRSSSRRLATVVRALAVGALTGALALVPGVALAHGGGPSGHAPRAVNHAPDRPADVGTSGPESSCSSSTAAALRSATPTLRATLSDPDGDALRGTFQVRDGRTGRLLWSSRATAAQASGSAHGVQVPEGLLRDGRAYEWRVQARDAKGRTSPVVRCRIAVDVTAPGLPTVAPVEGAGAVYAEDAVAGGIGVAGDFRFEAPGTDDVAAFLYAFDGAPAQVDVVPGDAGATVTWVPTSAGPHQLTVQAVDVAGNVGPERLYRFTVTAAPTAPAGARWLLDEGQGLTATDTRAGTTLTLTPSTTWADGMAAELWGTTTDRALLLDEADDGASTAGPVVDTTGSFSVATVVRVDADGAPATVVSQDGAAGSAFTLGTSTTACDEELTTCWAFAVAGTGGDTVVATSTVPVSIGSWYGVFGVRDATSGVLRVDVCHLGTVDEPGSPSSLTGADVSLDVAAGSDGPFRVGTAQEGSTPWVGAVSGVQTWGSVIDVTRERLICSGRM
ncbi:LamG domain-containing protein [Cellulomonas wangsupingiae]|uniref:LamG domain-containing protein n=1 Tax=Cellulomonas wangsupingiae TaxID=2968085 RepID=UPI001D0F4775|nr:LamG domain-containing protein [Cellulomonas wangsupingiae]MCM0639413.1 LamG domain-containing protein [Cellulomonas wangsupingiae]